MALSSVLSSELLAVRAAELYYEDDKTQDEVGSILGVTRWKVGRLLADAKARGVIRIEIIHPQARRLGLEHALCKKYGLEASVVVPSLEADSMQENVARAAADYLASMRPRTRQLGISWGKTLHRIAHYLPDGWTNPLSVVQVNGSVSQSANPGLAASTAITIAQKASGQVTLLPAPAIVERLATKRALESDRGVATVLEQALASDTFLFGAGPATLGSILVQSGYIDPSEISRLQQVGAVGDVLGRYIRADGTIADRRLDDRTLGLSLHSLRKAKRSIAAIAGDDKHDIARAVVKNGLATVLITDERTASVLLGDSSDIGEEKL